MMRGAAARLDVPETRAGLRLSRGLQISSPQARKYLDEPAAAKPELGAGGRETLAEAAGSARVCPVTVP